MDILLKYFPDLSPEQIERYILLESLYRKWNTQINVISRKDIDALYERHILHALSIAKLIQFTPGTRVLDVGTGGGFPGIPLAILFPETEFTLIDSIGKKIRVVEDISTQTNLSNVRAIQQRAEESREKYDFVVSRAVTAFPVFFGWTNQLIRKGNSNSLSNGILYLKGGDFEQEIASFKDIQTIPIHQWFDEPFFETKKIIYLPKK